jgi:uncharacterized LabA/DUF88 family protein
VPVSDRVAILLDGEFVKKALGAPVPNGRASAGRDRHRPHQGWEIGGAAIAELLSRRKTTIVPKDVIPKIQQKGVDMRAGLDIASLALKRLVAAIVVVSGDADLVPAMKLARREGLRVFLDTLGRTSVRSELKVHADRVQ